LEGKTTENKKIIKLNISDGFIKIGFYLLLLISWYIAARKISIPLLLPTPLATAKAFVSSLGNAKIMSNVWITLMRVIKGWLIALIVGIPIGIAMGGLGSDAAIEAADVVIMNDEPSKIAVAIRLAKRTLGIATQNIVFALLVKVVVLTFTAFGMVNMWAAVFADVGVTLLAIANAMRNLNIKKV